ARDAAGKLALLLGGHRGDRPRHHLAALRHIALQQLHVLVVDLRRFIAGERTSLAPAIEGAAGLGLRHAHQEPSSLPPAFSTSTGARASRGVKSRSRSRYSRLPPPPRPKPRSPRSRSPRSRSPRPP